MKKLLTSVEKLIPGVILLEDVLGKSGKPIMNKNTTLTETHIYFLKKFLIDEVRVASRLQDGTLFIPS